jgi:plastocyanin
LNAGRAILVGFGLLALAMGATACGGDDDDEPADGGPEPTATSQPGGGDEATVDVVIQDFAFSPTRFTLGAGDDVVIGLDNRDAAGHTFTVYLDEGFSEAQGTTLPVSAGSQDTIHGTFEAGTYFFRCEIHPATMQGSFTAE